MPKKSTKETDVKINAEAPKQAKRAATPKTAASTHKRGATKSVVETQAASAPAIVAPPATVEAEPASVQEQVARIAYFLWLDRDGETGDPQEDWYRAEQIVRSRKALA